MEIQHQIVNAWSFLPPGCSGTASTAAFFCDAHQRGIITDDELHDLRHQIGPYEWHLDRRDIMKEDL